MYCIAGFEKVKSTLEFSQMANHNFRLHLTKEESKRIDSSRSHLNRILLNPLEVDTKKSGDLNKKIQDYYLKNEVQVKEDSVLAVDMVLTTSPEFFQDGNLKDGATWHKNGRIRPEYQKKIDEWVVAQMDFVKNLFGESAIKMAVLHLDETTPHIHIILTPEQTKVLKYKNQFGNLVKLLPP
ncbi:plasmid recombination protein [Pandoraea nosoerga]|uniref:MobV family relaxase n=1 Tax=Pandoraea nosoerga TaxID=2508296 RepID=UPI00197EF2E8|nr:MobV family relaxase [Pandoraea nosoerga]MBN4676326.1 plasmid recombination protein [Pandoraea nosoerga]MBN4745437.1 plasmid recombination protein [Pandoraea nosoerga]